MNPSQTQDLYQRLGVSDKATKQEIKHAYRQQAKAWHPDKNLGNPRAEIEFKAVAEAYFILDDDKTKSEYDISKVVKTNSRRTEPKTSNPVESEFSDIDLDDRVGWHNFWNFQKEKFKNTQEVFKKTIEETIDINEVYNYETIVTNHTKIINKKYY
jgi:DnaJ-class molecular chaperone